MGDGFPSHICEKCEKELDNCYKFVLKCENSDKKFRSGLNLYSPKKTPGYEIPITSNEIEIEIKLEPEDPPYKEEDLQGDSLSIKSETVEVDVVKPQVKWKCKKRKYKKRIYKSEDSTCIICRRKCNSRSSLLIHMRSHTNDKPYHCTLCVKRYKDKGTLKRHVEKKHSGIQKEKKCICETCGKEFNTKSAIKIHLRTHTGEKPHACPFCPKKFTQISSLLRHKMRHTGERPHKCPICSKKFCTKTELKNHFPKHTSEKNYSCPICNASLKYLTNVKKHILAKHSESNSFICNHCGRTFNTKGALRSHIIRQHSEKSGYCNICSKNVSNIEVHMRKHTGERPMQCEHCSSSFHNLRSLSHHINFKHKYTDKHKCSTEGCQMSFPSKPMLAFHIAKLHGTEIPFPCKQCPRGFYRKSDLVRHTVGTHKAKLI